MTTTDEMPQASPLSSPFAVTELQVSTASEPPGASYASPFSDGLLTTAGEETEAAIGEFLAGELEDDEFAEALTQLGHEVAARQSAAPLEWDHEASRISSDTSEAEQWIENLAERTDSVLGELERTFAERSVDNVDDEEVLQLLEQLLPAEDRPESALDAQEMWFKSLRKKLGKVARAAKSMAKKGIKLASRMLPLGIIFRRLRPIIRPLLRRVLARAIGKLPASLRSPARRLAQKYGLRPAREFETEAEYFAATFDASAAEAILEDDAAMSAAQAETEADATDDAGEPNLSEQLDGARRRLADELLSGEAGEPPVAAMEQFIPVALLPIAKMGVKVAGRPRIIRYLGGLLAKLVAPVVGPQLARPLSTQIANQGLRLLGLEAETDDRLGADAVVAATEDTLHELFALPEAWLEDEVLLEAAAQEALQSAVTRYFPAAALRADLTIESPDLEHGLWTTMPRAAGAVHRYRKYSRRLPTRLSQAHARQVVFTSGETLEERLADAGIDSWPAEVEVEAFEFLPGTDLGHVAHAESRGQAVLDAAREFDSVQHQGMMALPENSELGRHRVVRVVSRGRALRRRTPLALRLDLQGSRPELRVHLILSERRAHLLAQHVRERRPAAIMTVLTRATGDPVRALASRRLARMLSARGQATDGSAAGRLSTRLFDALVAALASHIQTLSPSLAAAAKDPAQGVTVTATFAFESPATITATNVGIPTLKVRPGTHRD